MSNLEADEDEDEADKNSKN